MTLVGKLDFKDDLSERQAAWLSVHSFSQRSDCSTLSAGNTRRPATPIKDVAASRSLWQKWLALCPRNDVEGDHLGCA